jgi:hypothetical protein
MTETVCPTLQICGICGFNFGIWANRNAPLVFQKITLANDFLGRIGIVEEAG